MSAYRASEHEGCDALWINAQLATMTPGTPYGAIMDGALAVKDGRIEWVGARSSLPKGIDANLNVHDAGGCWITPGLIDCHTHIVYAGNRAGEFEQRLNGASYEEIARNGGGIAATVAATRAASEDVLFAQSAARLARLLSEGVTTIEIKSGYGLDRDTEAKMLRVARELGRRFNVRVRNTYLGAHAVPPEFAGRPDAYVDFVCDDVMPALAGLGLVDAVDAFCDTIGFTHAQTARVFAAARRAGLPVKLHAEQLSDQNGAALAAQYGALSADHLEHLSTKRHRGDGRGRDGGSVASCGVLFLARHARAADRRAARCRRSDGGRHRLQSWHVADDFTAADHEHGLYVVSLDAS